MNFVLVVFCRVLSNPCRRYQEQLSVNVCMRRVVEYAVDTQDLNLSAIRTIRVLRPLRAINRIPSQYTRPAFNLWLKY